ncbi:hypothetical protein [Halogeometricum limi]|uniref:Phage tail assembly chaperone protein, E, or 41 or 14 n=1 Tax=Halogeometricum limi TaxID=555875 RepID=A0A1I6IEG1_9EURY|nr:hypothetical protein [Halogeometricum limi]SFR65112.1 hypothetical protein SAMN04488124_3144 [Halogeometricum limi]
MSSTPLQVEVPFRLPKGYADAEGTLHRDGVMRLATAADEILPLKDPRVKSNPSYLSVILLSRVVTELGDVESVTPNVVENLFVSDLAYLQDLYTRVNAYESNAVETACPACGEVFAAEIDERAQSEPDAGDGDEGNGQVAEGNLQSPVGVTTDRPEG